jgi:formylmethanofuran dehydrogenase subunit C
MLVLRLKGNAIDAADGSWLQPSFFLSKGGAGLSELVVELRDGSPSVRSVRLGELFEIEGNPSDHLVLEGDFSKWTGIGRNLREGRLTVRGSVGDCCGERMSGGLLEVTGNAGNFLAVGMRKGRIVVNGSAGDAVAGPMTGATRGMQGGECFVLGDVGERLGERMRRGLVLVGGSAGSFGANQMIAGTIVVCGAIGQSWAMGMRRGSIILFREPGRAFSAELTVSREFELSFLPLLWRHLSAALPNSGIRFPLSRWANRQVGDRANQGVGEILVLSRQDTFDLVKNG